MLMNTKEKIKNFWKAFKKNKLWVNIGVYIGITIWTWVLFCGGFVNLVFAIFFTIIIPLSIPLVYYVRKSKHVIIIAKIVFVSFGIFSLGGIMWIITSYVLVAAPWAPLRILIGDAVIRGRINLLMLISSYAIGGYIMYRVGKKRKWRPPAHFEIE
jgi:membrane-bound ClpP family serine protease